MSIQGFKVIYTKCFDYKTTVVILKDITFNSEP